MEVLCVGEVLIDFFASEVNQNLIDAEHFEKQAGGAPANVAAAIVALGGAASFCGKVGDDAFGHFLERTLLEKGVSTRYLVKGAVPTTMAFVSRVTGGERDFSFVRGADATLAVDDVPLNQMKPAIAHFGSATALLTSPFFDTYMTMMRELKTRGVWISFDPNYRAALWQQQLHTYQERVAACLKLADFVKMSEEEWTLTPFTPQAQYVVVTKGQAGAWISDGTEERVVNSISVKSVDATGAGDAFVGAMLKQMADTPIKDFKQFARYVEYSNIVGAICCTKVGAMTALPTDAQVQMYRKKA